MNNSRFDNRPVLRMLHNWRQRHQHPFNFGIHLIGIPMTLAGMLLFLILPWQQWYWCTGAIILGYVLQYLGHLVEGNDLGEWAAVKKILGLPYVGISPRWEKSEQETAQVSSARCQAPSQEQPQQDHQPMTSETQ